MDNALEESGFEPQSVTEQIYAQAEALPPDQLRILVTRLQQLAESRAEAASSQRNQDFPEVEGGASIQVDIMDWITPPETWKLLVYNSRGELFLNLAPLQDLIRMLQLRLVMQDPRCEIDWEMLFSIANDYSSRMYSWGKMNTAFFPVPFWAIGDDKVKYLSVNSEKGSTGTVAVIGDRRSPASISEGFREFFIDPGTFEWSDGYFAFTVDEDARQIGFSYAGRKDAGSDPRLLGGSPGDKVFFEAVSNVLQKEGNATRNPKIRIINYSNGKVGVEFDLLCTELQGVQSRWFSQILAVYIEDLEATRKLTGVAAGIKGTLGNAMGDEEFKRRIINAIAAVLFFKSHPQLPYVSPAVIVPAPLGMREYVASSDKSSQVKALADFLSSNLENLGDLEKLIKNPDVQMSAELNRLGEEIKKVFGEEIYAFIMQQLWEKITATKELLVE